MKKLALLLVSIALSLTTQAQEKGKLRLGFNAGPALGFGSENTGSGFFIGMEPKYNIKDNMSLGFRMRRAILFRISGYKSTTESGETLSNFTFDFGSSASFYLTYDYYLRNKRFFAPYVGCGLGYVSQGSIGFNVKNDNGETLVGSSTVPDSKLGAMIRVGFDCGKFRFGLEYNMLPQTEFLVKNTAEKIGEISNNYFAFSVGLYVGGGKRK